VNGLRVSPRKLERAAAGLLTAAGAGRAVASDVASALVSSSLRGIDTHGIVLLPKILDRAGAGRTQLRLPAVAAGRHARRPVAMVDARLSPGQHAGLVASRLAAAKAARFGIGFVTVRNSVHFGACTPFLLEILRRRFVAFVGSNSSQSMAAFGARRANLGNNPFGFAAPVKRGPDFLFDASSSVMSFGKRGRLKAAGLPVPADAFITPEPAKRRGKVVYEIASTLDQVALPFGGYKGASVAMMIETLSALLGGGHFGEETESLRAGAFLGPSHFFLAIDPRAFAAGGGPFEKRMAAYVAGVRSAAPGMRLPGDGAAETAERRMRGGIPIDDALRSALEGRARALDFSLGWN
jgi:LDH2 family malate/lactate/ureidoglycolate dehydrogenase